MGAQSSGGLESVCWASPSSLAFTVVSKTSDGNGFKARVRLYDLLKKKLDQDDTEVVKGQTVDDDQFEVKQVDLGTYDFDQEFDAATAKRGTTIIADDIHPAFAQSFQRSLGFEKFKPPPLEWTNCLKLVSKVHSLQELGDYWRLLWELAASCPIPFVNAHAVPEGLVKEDHQRLINSDFSVLVDNRKLYKPVYLRGHAAGYTCRKIKPEARKIYGKDLRFHGYVVVQEGKQLKPDELRGILIRIKNVAIGYYDPSMLDYRTNEGPRSRWLTGEVFVDEGLEDALNIDRDSFNRVHPEFRAIQDHVHGVLKDIFSDVWRNIDVRSDQRARTIEKARKQHLGSVISHAIDAPVKVKTAGSEVDNSPTVAIKEVENRVEVDLPPPDSLSTKKSHRQLAAAILALFEVAMREKSTEKRREAFTKLVLDLLAGW